MGQCVGQKGAEPGVIGHPNGRLASSLACLTFVTKRRTVKLPHTLTLMLSVGVLLVQTGAAVLRVSRERDLFERDIGRDERVLGRALAYAVERAWASGGESEAQAVIDHANERTAQTQIRWMRLDALPGKPAPLADRKLLEPLRHGESVLVTSEWPDDALLTYVPVRLANADLWTIEIADAMVDERSYILRSVWSAAVTSLLIVGLCAAAAWVLTLRIVRDPIALLIQQARAVARGDLHRRVEVRGSDELLTLANEMNRMCDQLQTASDTARSEAAARLRTTEQLRHADRLATVGLLASSIAHELGTPINVINGHAQLLAERSSEPGSEREHVSVIRDQCGRMTDILRQLLDFGRVGRKADETCSVDTVLLESRAMVLPMARAAMVDVDVDAEANLVAAIGAPSLQQIVLNLLINALQASPSGGRVAIEARPMRRERSGARGEQAMVKISLRDMGPGIPNDLQQQIFEPFFTTRGGRGGTGLGLFIASGIAREYGGWLEVQSEPGAGSIFSIHLPVERHDDSPSSDS